MSKNFDDIPAAILAKHNIMCGALGGYKTFGQAYLAIVWYNGEVDETNSLVPSPKPLLTRQQVKDALEEYEGPEPSEEEVLIEAFKAKLTDTEISQARNALKAKRRK